MQNLPLTKFLRSDTLDFLLGSHEDALRLPILIEANLRDLDSESLPFLGWSQVSQ